MHKIDISLGISKLFILLVLSITVGSLLIVSYLKISMSIRFLLSIFVIFYAFYILQKYVLLKQKHSIHQLKLTDDQWVITDSENEYVADLCGSSTVTSLLCVLRFRVKDQHRLRSCIIFKDALVAEQYRRLRVRCR